jgi:hypothetical protein
LALVAHPDGKEQTAVAVAGVLASEPATAAVEGAAASEMATTAAEGEEYPFVGRYLQAGEIGVCRTLCKTAGQVLAPHHNFYRI